MINIFQSKLPMFDGRQFKTSTGTVWTCVGFVDNEGGQFVLGADTEANGETRLNTFRLRDVTFLAPPDGN